MANGLDDVALLLISEHFVHLVGGWETRKPLEENTDAVVDD